MKRVANLCLSVVLLATTVEAVVREVPTDHATIQGAIGAANDGDVIVVLPGQYDENINFSGKDIALTSLDPNDPNTVAATILMRVGEPSGRRGPIDASRNGSVVSFMSGESAAALLTGFTIKGGYGTDLGGNQFFGGGVLAVNASPTIVKNVVTENLSALGIQAGQAQGIGAGICCLESGAYVAYNTVHGNAGSIGGGIVAAGGNGVVFNNLVFNNEGAVGGGAAVFGGTLLNNTLVANSATEIGGNLYTASGGDFGQSQIHNNIACFATRGSGVYVETDQASDWYAHNNVFGNAPTNYFIQGQDPGDDTKTGEFGNLSTDPRFVARARFDFHLRDDSLCIDAGLPDFDPGVGALDMAGEPRLRGAAVDIGAFESTVCTSPMADAGPDQEVAPEDLVVLDGSRTTFCDPNAQQLFLWDQSSGPSAQLDNPRSPTPTFVAEVEGAYRFELMVFDGVHVSRPDEVLITVTSPRRGASN